MNERILLNHGSGGEMTRQLIREIFVRHFDNEKLRGLSDAACLGSSQGSAFLTTDSYVVDPIFFPGGDIGKLAVCGTVNDLAVAGAVPSYLSAGFILEEGLSMQELTAVVASMAREARKAGVHIVTGDTKVVNRGKADKIYINTAGVGYLHPRRNGGLDPRTIREGDQVVVNGNLGDHGVAVLAAREGLEVSSRIQSDCASLNRLIHKLLDNADGIRFMRDLTRGGLATVMCEIAEDARVGLQLYEQAMPVDEQVRGLCEMLGLDPLYLANEGKFMAVVDGRSVDGVMETLRADPLGQDARVVGEVVAARPGRVVMETQIGGSRIIDMLSGEQLPRIC